MTHTWRVIDRRTVQHCDDSANLSHAVHGAPMPEPASCFGAIAETRWYGPAVAPKTAERSAATQVGLGALVANVLRPPPPELDRFLDGAQRCFVRFGFFRTSVQDIARELGVNRATIYRQIGTIDDIAQLLAARELVRVIDVMPWRPGDPIDPDMVVTCTVYFVESGRNHPVIAKVLADEPDTVSTRILRVLPTLLEGSVEALAPLLALGMTTGGLASRNPELLAEWIIRNIVTLILVPPRRELKPFLAEMLLPALTPSTHSGRQR